MHTLSLNVLFDPLDAAGARAAVTGAIIDTVGSKLQLGPCPPGHNAQRTSTRTNRDIQC